MDFTTSDTPQETALTRRVYIGWEHDVVEGDDGDEIVYRTDEDGNRVKKSYLVPVRLTAREVIARSKSLNPGTIQGLATGDLEALVELLDAMVGGGVVEAVGTDRTVSTEEFLRFLNWLVDELKLTDILGGSPGN
jgi:hypothetical protein